MFCKNCGTEMEATSAFCESCGAKNNKQQLKPQNNQAVYSCAANTESAVNEGFQQQIAKPKSNKKFIIIAAIIVGVVLLFVYISQSANKTIIGKWEIISGGGDQGYMWFEANGKAKYNDDICDYSVVGDTIKIETGWRPVEYQYKLNKDTLCLKRSDNFSTIILKRVG